jgi:hypothetical protein
MYLVTWRDLLCDRVRPLYTMTLYRAMFLPDRQKGAV